MLLPHQVKTSKYCFYLDFDYTYFDTGEGASVCQPKFDHL